METGSIRLKVIPVAIAWIIIFMHGAIPHNHHQEHKTGCTAIYHCCHDGDHSTGNTGRTAETLTPGADSEDRHFVCHFNTAPFHPLDNDTPFYTEKGRGIQPAESDELIINVCYSQPFIPNNLYLPDNLRAPPARMGKV